MKLLCFVPFFLTTFAECTTEVELPASLQDSLDAKYKAKGKKYFGTCADRATLSKPKNAEIVRAQFGQVTPENSMKWLYTEKRQGQFSFQDPDFLVDWARNNSKLVRGHTLLWHSQIAQWVSNIQNPAQIKDILEKHVTAEVSQYRGKIYAWDVANEIFEENGSFRNSAWHRKDKGIDMEEMIKVAFEAAKKADPHAKLYINDYNLDTVNYPKTRAMINKVKQWRAAGVPIDGIGTQAHLKPGQANGILAALQALCAVAPECAVTELDIEGSNPQEYATAVRACLRVPNCVGTTVWGVSDIESWRKDKRPLMYDGDFREKEAFKAALAAIS